MRRAGEEVARIVSAVEPVADGRRHRDDEVYGSDVEARERGGLDPVGEVVPEPKVPVELVVEDHLPRLALEAHGARGVLNLVDAVLGPHERNSVQAVGADVP